MKSFWKLETSSFEVSPTYYLGLAQSLLLGVDVLLPPTAVQEKQSFEAGYHRLYLDLYHSSV